MNARPGTKSALAWLAATLCAGPAGQTAFAADPVNAPGGELRYEEPKTLTAVIYTRNTSPPKALFNFKRVATRSGSTLNVVREYSDPDGKPALRERIVYEGDELVSLKLEELQIDARGSATIRRQSGKSEIQFEYAKEASAGGKPKTASESLRQDTVVDDMIGPFIAAHWDILMKGQPAKCRYLCVPRRETLGFTFTKDGETTWKDQPAVLIKMEATSFIIAALVDPMFFTVEKGGRHRVLRYVGRTAPKLRAGDKWNDLDAVTVFE